MIPKFRVWRVDTEVMAEVRKIDFRANTTTSTTNIEYKGVRLHFRDAILMQSTGLKDKKDKEIFEGDIIKDLKIDGIGQMIFGNYEGCSDEWGKSKHIAWHIKWHDEDPPTYSTIGWHEEFEVIGNIYENKEPLK